MYPTLRVLIRTRVAITRNLMKVHTLCDTMLQNHTKVYKLQKKPYTG